MEEEKKELKFEIEKIEQNIEIIEGVIADFDNETTWESEKKIYKNTSVLWKSRNFFINYSLEELRNDKMRRLQDDKKQLHDDKKQLQDKENLLLQKELLLLQGKTNVMRSNFYCFSLLIILFSYILFIV